MINLTQSSWFYDAYVSVGSVGLCPERWVGDTHGQADVVVGRCGGPAPKQNAARSGGLAYCVPPLYPPLASQTVLQDVRSQQRLGVRHTYIYDTDCATPYNFPHVTHLCMRWAHNVLIPDRGQNWMINECLLRAASDGWEWALMKDVDESIVFRTPPSVSYPLSVLARRSDVDVITFGRMYDGAPQCSSSWWGWGAWGAWIAWLRGKSVQSIEDDRYMCLGSRGRRKWMSRTTNSVWFGNIHEVRSCVATCRIWNLDSREIWLNHSRVKSTYVSMPRG